MRSKLLLFSVTAILIATTTVSAALLPLFPATPGPVTEATTWQQLPTVRVIFPDNLDIDVESVYVIKTADQWDAFWSTVPDVTVEGTPTGELPYVDFEHNFAVIASYAWKEEGYAIDVTDAQFNGHQVYVQVDRQEPNPDNCRPYFDPFYGGIAIIQKPDVANFESTPVGATYQQVLEAEWDIPSRAC